MTPYYDHAGILAHCCVTSPPYWGLRNYGVDGQIGLERSPDEYVGAPGGWLLVGDGDASGAADLPGLKK